jgi:hypothetical protein
MDEGRKRVLWINLKMSRYISFTSVSSFSSFFIFDACVITPPERAFVILHVNSGDADENCLTLSRSVERAYNEHAFGT